MLQAWDMAKKKKPTKGKFNLGQWQSDKHQAVPFRDVDIAGINLWQAIDAEVAAKTERIKSQLDPERRLLLAILEDAVYLLKYQTASAKPWRTQVQINLARIWLESDEHFDCFCFVSICWAFGFDHQYLRRGIKKFIAQPPPSRKRRPVTKMVKLRGHYGNAAAEG